MSDTDERSCAARGSRPVAVAWEYFFRDTRCNAAHAAGSRCICWHKEGTGPQPNASRGDADSAPREWRKYEISLETITDDELAFLKQII
jgi:hypothetical protein